MKNLRTKVLEYMQHQSKWITAAAVAEAIGTQPMNVHRIMRSEEEKIERATMDTGRAHGGKFVSVFRINSDYKKYTTTGLALSLAKTHTGMFGQLYWVNHEKILYGVSERQAR
jgi:hypothetical protein